MMMLPVFVFRVSAFLHTATEWRTPLTRPVVPIDLLQVRALRLAEGTEGTGHVS